MDEDSDVAPSTSESPACKSNDVELEPVITAASAPFDSPYGDVILRTSDSVDFRVLRFVLALASPVFGAMFSLPQPATKLDEPASIPIIPISESSATIDLLLRLCYPVEVPRLSNRLNVPRIGLVLEAALKYDISHVVSHARDAILELAEKDYDSAVAAYAVACHLKLEELARAAALACLKWPFPGPTVPQLSLMSGLDYYNLLEYHKKAGETVASLFQKNRYKFMTETCVAITPRSHTCQGSTKLSYTLTDNNVEVNEYLFWSEAKNILSEAFKTSPSAMEKLSLSSLAPAVTATNCHICKNKFLHGWDQTREAIATVIKKRISKVPLSLSWM
ncbi:uncharacterized protein FOMMEDRAFT_165098 [Fomitiporia mediterranea MF3/22]|uniref:uncharacterized protein n=1 Tax=Fomitiporia mediterranea (strain MF3/22) TaxID=694068 RepID=UPI0004407C5D|nr:uncharacterized protein FOMMEDRAFT_165098 [Fomitiporia mediterranea MF3/22]EJD08546.1 hypothetical protein FOMMEDRAFT_165098 [Fomitiporia mediterranea MF3/22]